MDISGQIDMTYKKKVIFSKLNFTLPIILGIAIFIFSRPLIVNALDWKDTLNTNFEVDTSISDDNYRQIIIRDGNGEMHFLTNEATTHANPSYDQNYIAWMAIVDKYWQIFVYDIRAKKYIQLTNGENNVNPKVNRGQIVWEGQRDGVWQIFMYDGLKITQVTKDTNPKQGVEIENGYIAFSQKNVSNNIWEILLYDITDKTIKTISSGQSSSLLNMKDNKIIWETTENGDYTKYAYDLVSKKYDKETKKNESSEATVSIEQMQNLNHDEEIILKDEVTSENIVLEMNDVEQSSVSANKNVVTSNKEIPESSSSN